MIYDTGIP